MPMSLTNTQTRTVSKKAASGWGSDEPAGAFEVPDLVTDDDRLFRIVEVPDRAASLRRVWLDRVVKCDQQYNNSHDPVRYLSQAADTFSVLLISGDDLPRVSAILREVREVLPSKVVVPVLRNCPPSKVMAAFLRRGAADILHCRMAPREGAARLFAIVRRVTWAGGRMLLSLEEEERRRESLRSVVCQPLTPMEERLLAVLVERVGRVAPYSRIALRLGSYWEIQSSNKSIQVAVHKLRRKLRVGFEIENHWGLGYTLRSKAIPAYCAEKVYA